MNEKLAYNERIIDPSSPFFFIPIILCLVIIFFIVNTIIYYYNKNYSHLIIPSADNSWESLENNELKGESRLLRYKYLIAYVFTRASVWSKSPYLYTMYNKYHGFSIEEIGILYVIDAVTALISGPFLGNLADKYGRKMFCVNYCILVITNLSLRITGNKSMAYLAQILTGLGAGLIMTTFESWVNYEASQVFKENGQLKERFLKKLFKSQSLLDALTSLCVTFITAICFAKFGILFPIVLSIVFAILAMLIIVFFWSENKPNSKKLNQTSGSILDAFKELKKREVLSIGVMESLYNAVVNIFIFSWTPILQNSTQAANLQVGFVFLCFVCSVIIGTSLFDFFIITLKYKFYLSMSVVLFIDIILFMSTYFNEFFTHRLIFLACIEGLTGFYLPLNSIVKSKILVERHRATLMSIFRIPLNIYVIVVLLCLKYLNPFTICLIASGMLSVAFIIACTLYIFPPQKIQVQMRKFSDLDYSLLDTREN